MNVARVFDQLRHHIRRLRILNGFGFRWHRRIIDTQGARLHIVRRDGVQRRMFSRPFSHGPAMAYMSHGRADAESLLEFMDSRRRPTSEILVIFLGQPMSAEVGDASPTFL